MAAPDCFGLQQDLVLRIAVVDVGGKALLVWQREDRSAGVDTMALVRWEQKGLRRRLGLHQVSGRKP